MCFIYNDVVLNTSPFDRAMGGVQFRAEGLERMRSRPFHGWVDGPAQGLEWASSSPPLLGGQVVLALIFLANIALIPWVSALE